MPDYKLRLFWLCYALLMVSHPVCNSEGYVMAKVSKAKYVEPKWQFVKYATHRGYYAALTKKGNKFYTVLWFGNGYPLSVIKVGHEEGRFFETLGPFDDGVKKWAKYERSIPWTKAAEKFFSEAKAYVKYTEEKGA